MWKFPSYRFGALLITFLKDDKTPEGITEIDNALSQADSLPSPFKTSEFLLTVRAMASVLNAKLPSEATRVALEAARLDSMPVEEKKRQEAIAAGKPFRVPEWWRGEQANYKVAKTMMKTLPKKIGPLKDQ